MRDLSFPVDFSLNQAILDWAHLVPHHQNEHRLAGQPENSSGSP
jgi:hypothetical protein